MRGWERRLSSEDGAHPGVGLAGVTSRRHSLNWIGPFSTSEIALATSARSVRESDLHQNEKVSSSCWV
jgi:hypothetical protein